MDVHLFRSGGFRDCWWCTLLTMFDLIYLVFLFDIVRFACCRCLRSVVDSVANPMWARWSLSARGYC